MRINIKISKRSKTILSLFGVMFFISFSIIKLSNYLQFLINDTQATFAIKIHENMTRYNYSIDYTYYVDKIQFNGSDSKVLPFSNIKNEFVVLFLEKMPDKSIVKQFIIPNVLFYLVLFIVFFTSGLFMLLGIIGKLPVKYQENYNKYLIE